MPIVKYTYVHRLYLATTALSFYRSQNDLGLFKFFEPHQKLNCILCRSKKICAGTKTEFTEWKLSFGLAQNVNQFLVWHKVYYLVI